VEGKASLSHLLVVELLRLPGLEELQQVSESAFIVVPEWVAWTIPVPERKENKKLGSWIKMGWESRGEEVPLN